MSYFASFLDKYLKRAQLTQAQVAEQFGIVVSHVNKLLTGRRTGLNPKTIKKISKKIGSDRQLMAELVCAYLKDQCPGDDILNLVTIEPKLLGAPRVGEDPSVYGSNDPVCLLAEQLRASRAAPKFIECLRRLAQSATDCPELQRVLEDLTKLKIQSKKNG